MERIWLKQYDANVPADIDSTLYSSISDLLTKSFLRFKDRPSFHNMGKSLTYGDLDELSKQFGSYLQNTLKVRKGDRVAIMLPNVLQYPVAAFAILRIGAVVVNVNPLYTARELRHQLNDSGAETILILANFAHVLQEILPETHVKNVIVTEVGDLLGFPKSLIVNSVIKYVKKMVPPYQLPESVSFHSALSKGDSSKIELPSLIHSDIAFLQYTGGTTGVSKGAVLTHGNIIANVLQAGAWMKNLLEEGKEIVFTPLPLYHIFSLTANCLIFTTMGGLNVLITNPRDIPGFIAEMKKWKFTAMTGVNTLFNALLNHADFKSVDFSHMKLTLGGGMAVQQAVAERWKKVTGKPLIEAYGLTETSPAACINPFSMKDYNGCIGLPISSTWVTILDEAGKELPPETPGELAIKGPQVFKGYWQRKDETDKVFTSDGWFKTGDMAVMYPNGYFKLVDRKKDMILVSGFNVYPNEIEEVISGFEGVLEVAAIGIPDEHSGEAVKVFIVAKDPSLTKEQIIAHCRKNLTGYKVPKAVEFRKELPKTNVGKILRRALREESST